MPSSPIPSSSSILVLPNTLAGLITIPLSLYLTVKLTGALLTSLVPSDSLQTPSVDPATKFGEGLGTIVPGSDNFRSVVSSFVSLFASSFLPLYDRFTVTFSPLTAAVAFHFFLGIATLLSTLNVAAPYGTRLTHSKQDSKALKLLCRVAVAATPSWIFQELPTLLAFGALVFLTSYSFPSSSPLQQNNFATQTATVVEVGDAQEGEGNTLTTPHFSLSFYPTIILYIIHYIHRTLIFPWFLANGRGYWFKSLTVDETPSEIPSTAKTEVDAKKGAEKRLASVRHNPLLTVLLAAFYCSFNGSLQVVANSIMTPSGLSEPNAKGVGSTSGGAFAFFGNFGEMFGFTRIGNPALFYAGVTLFFLGMYINVRCDYYMFAIGRARHQQHSGNSTTDADGGRALIKRTYVIPDLFWYSLVAAPNYLGEILEWSGYAVALYGCSSAGTGFGADGACSGGLRFLAAASFAFYTFSNLGPRAVASLQWYRKTFGDEKYRTRWALIPFVF